MLVDTHGHLNLNAFSEDREKVLKRALDANMGLIMPGTQYRTSKNAVKLAKEWNNPKVWASVGLHPIHVNQPKELDEFESDHLPEEDGFNRKKYEELLKSKQVVAVGEIGLDYWRKPKTTARKEEYVANQKKVLNEQLDMALDHKKPLILHCRVAHKDMLKLLEEHPIVKEMEIPGVIHSYTGSKKQFDRYAKMGFYIGVNALVQKLDFVEEAVSQIPLNRIVLETDSPYLTPLDAKGERNEPHNLRYTAQKVAQLHNTTLEEVEKVTTANAQRVFNVDFE